MLGVMLQLCLDPDTTNRTCCMTEVILDSNNPLFDEKFSLYVSYYRAYQYQQLERLSLKWVHFAKKCNTVYNSNSVE